MKRIYLVGAISSPDPAQLFRNLRAGHRESARIIKSGDAVWSPFTDFLLLFQEHDLTVEEMYENSLSWMERADEVRVLPGWENSVGAKKEIARAVERGIPVIYL